MCHYTHLTPFEREKILFFLAEGKSVTEIAHLLNRSKSTISRELRRSAAPADQSMSYCPLRSSCSGNYGITRSGVTRKAAKNVGASSSYRIPSRIVLPVRRTVPSVVTGKRIPWWASREKHTSSRWWIGRAGT